jgi:hypothetical protein
MLPTYHADNLARLQQVCAAGCERGFAKESSRDWQLVRQIPFPALLAFAGLPKLRNQQCFAHERRNHGISLSFFPYRDDDEHWIFCCNNPACDLHGIYGDQAEFWYQMVRRAGLAPSGWSRLRATGDLLARAESGQIDVTKTEFDDAGSGLHRRPAADCERDDFCSGDGYWEKLGQLIAEHQGRPIAGSCPLPKPVPVSVHQVIRRLFPENRYVMLAKERRKWHPIKLRDDWFAHCYRRTCQCSFVSQNYCSHSDVDGASYAAFDGIQRRWLVIESDRGTLEQQFWLHQHLGPTCVCWSGNQSLHGWYLVEGWSVEQCYELYAQAIRLGVNDRQTWLMCTQARLPAGFNWQTDKKQKVYVWS